jgi:hypothetical protein
MSNARSLSSVSTDFRTRVLFVLDLSNATVKRNAYLEAHVADLEVEIEMWRRAHHVALEAFVTSTSSTL